MDSAFSPVIFDEVIKAAAARAGVAKPATVAFEPERPAGEGEPARRPFTALLPADLKRPGDAPRKWIWNGYLVAGGVTLLTSLWKAGKTTLVAVLLAKMKSGGELAGRPVTAGRVVVVSEENRLQWDERSGALGYDTNVCFFCQPFLGKPRLEEWQALIDQIAAMHDRQPIDLVAIDSLANLSPMRSESEATEMLRTLSPLRALTSRGIGVLVLHHPRKGRVLAGQAARGSGALTGFADVIVEMKRVSRRDLKDRRRRLLAYSRQAETPPVWVIEWTGGDYRGLGESAEPDFEHGWPVLKGVLENSRGTMTLQQILQEWPNEVLRPAKNTLWTWLDRGGKDGLVLKEGAGTKKEPHRYWLPGIEAKWQENMMKWWEKEFGVVPRRREETEDGEQEAGVGDQGSGVGDQESGADGGFLCADPGFGGTKDGTLGN
jgi:hypothetical protein